MSGTPRSDGPFFPLTEEPAMSSSPPPIPPDQRSGGPAATSNAAEAQGLDDRRDRVTNAQSGQPGDADVNLEEQGRFGNIEQNVNRVQHKVQDR